MDALHQQPVQGPERLLQHGRCPSPAGIRLSLATQGAQLCFSLALQSTLVWTGLDLVATGAWWADRCSQSPRGWAEQSWRSLGSSNFPGCAALHLATPSSPITLPGLI